MLRIILLVEMKTGRMVHIMLGLSLLLLLLLQFSDAEDPSQCFAPRSWETTVCSVRWDGAFGEVTSKPCWEPEEDDDDDDADDDHESDLACLPDYGDIPENGAYDIHRCLRKDCSEHSDCRTFCGADNKCEASSNDLARSGRCWSPDDCLAGHVCTYDDCFRLDICKPIHLAKERALCEVTYESGYIEQWPCIDSTDFVCVADNTGNIGIPGATAIKRCDYKRCTSDSDCAGVCTSRGKCNPFPDDYYQGQYGAYFAGMCEPTDVCIGGYECCLDHDYKYNDDPTPSMCQPADRCNQNSGGDENDD